MADRASYDLLHRSLTARQASGVVLRCQVTNQCRDQPSRSQLLGTLIGIARNPLPRESKPYREPFMKFNARTIDSLAYRTNVYTLKQQMFGL